MFQFTTTTLINDNLDYTTKLPRWSVQQEKDDKVGTVTVYLSLAIFPKI